MTFYIHGMEYKRQDESDMRMATSQRLGSVAAAFGALYHGIDFVRGSESCFGFDVLMSQIRIIIIVASPRRMSRCHVMAPVLNSPGFG
jgi:hypothetical protein